MKEQVLHLLHDANDYISGEDISNRLGVSRTAIWKVMNQLKEQGYEIESITRKGYKLITSPDLLNKEELHYNLQTDFIGKEICTYKTLGSTNQEAKKLALEGLCDGAVIIANEQTAGKGRRGRFLGVAARHRHLDVYFIKTRYTTSECFYDYIGCRTSCL